MDKKNLKVAEANTSVQRALRLANQLKAGGLALSDDTLFQGFKR